MAHRDPLDLKSLEGEVVVLGFGAIWCGPCHNDFATLKQIHGNEDSKIKVIRVHSPGTPLEEINIKLKEFKLEDPIYIDLAADPKMKTWGEMAGYYSIHGIPHSIVIDQNGKVAGHGTLSEAYSLALEIQRANKDADKKH